MSNDRPEAFEARPLDALSNSPRVIFFGRDCPLSIVPLQSLVTARIDVVAVAVWRNRPDRRAVHLRTQPAARLPLANSTPPTLPGVAAEHGIPVVEIGDLTHPATCELLASMEPDIFAVSCFPRLIPDSLLAIPRIGAINLHPSLLPQLRGPDPLFWTFRFSIRRSGVTVHVMNDQFDAGPIVRRQAFDVPEGVSGIELEQQAASIGGELLVRAVLDLGHGIARHIPQAEELASYQSWPGSNDLQIDVNWEADRIWNFVRGILPFGYTPTILIEDQAYAIDEAIRFLRNGFGDVPDVITDGVLTLIRESGKVVLGVRPLEASETADISPARDQ